MRRALLLSSLAAAGLGTFATAQQAPSRQEHRPDPRLLGTWRSDKERTTRLWRYTKEISTENREKFEAIFGKLVWRITEDRWDAEFEDQKWGGPYSVLALDKRSVVVSHPGDPDESAEIKQYFFEPGYMYVLAGYSLEFFKRTEA
jgi:hypothetical protein